MNWSDEKSFDAVKEFLPEMLAVIEKWGICLQEQKRLRLLLAADEILSNIISYAYLHRGETGTIKLKCTVDNKTLVLNFIDNGKPFNPMKNIADVRAKNVADTSPGGFGRILIQNFAEKISYKYKNGQNILSLSFGL